MQTASDGDHRGGKVYSSWFGWFEEAVSRAKPQLAVTVVSKSQNVALVREEGCKGAPQANCWSERNRFMGPLKMEMHVRTKIFLTEQAE
jgi:hypothetical protein